MSRAEPTNTDEPVAWWCEKADGTGFSTDFDPGEWPGLTVYRLFKSAQPQPSQQAGTEREADLLKIALVAQSKA